MDDDALYRSGGRTAHPAGLTVDELNAIAGPLDVAPGASLRDGHSDATAVVECVHVSSRSTLFFGRGTGST